MRSRAMLHFLAFDAFISAAFITISTTASRLNPSRSLRSGTQVVVPFRPSRAFMPPNPAVNADARRRGFAPAAVAGYLTL